MVKNLLPLNQRLGWYGKADFSVHPDSRDDLLSIKNYAPKWAPLEWLVGDTFPWLKWRAMVNIHKK